MNPQELKELDRKYIWHPFTVYPIKNSFLMTRASGAYVFDHEGKAYFDATSSWWCILHGHCHPRLVGALKSQAENLDQILFAPHSHPVAIELATRLIGQLGPPFSKVFYSDNGSTSIECAMKICLQYFRNRGEERTLFLSIDRSYHGDTLGAMSLGGIETYHQHSPLKALKGRAPYCYRCELSLKFPTCEIQCLDRATEILMENANKIAALFIEPLILGAGGMVHYPNQYLEKLVEICRSHGILIVFDEVFTGFGRTGTFFAFSQTEVKPDIVCLSKGLTSGMLPLGVTSVTDRIFDAFKGLENTFYHGHTFTGNGLSTRVALESLKIFEDEKVLKRLHPLIEIFRNARERFLSLPHVGDVRHLGMIWAVELVKDKVSKLPPNPQSLPGNRIVSSMWNKGYWLRPLFNVIYLIPPYCTTETELKVLLDVLYTEISDERHFIDS